VAVRTPALKEKLHRRGLWLEWFTVAWNVVEAVVAVGVGLVVGSVALVGFGVDSGMTLLYGLLHSDVGRLVPQDLAEKSRGSSRQGQPLLRT
jgi:predicted Co/Zn/Cd cation transporter (cation efflux family)